MKHSLRVETTLDSLLRSYQDYKDGDASTISVEDLTAVYNYFADTSEEDGLCEVLVNMSNKTDCYITFNCQYVDESNCYTFEVMFDGYYFGFELLIEDTTVTLYNGLDYGEHDEPAINVG